MYRRNLWSLKFTTNCWQIFLYLWTAGAEFRNPNDYVQDNLHSFQPGNLVQLTAPILWEKWMVPSHWGTSGGEGGSSSRMPGHLEAGEVSLAHHQARKVGQVACPHHPHPPAPCDHQQAKQRLAHQSGRHWHLPAVPEGEANERGAPSLSRRHTTLQPLSLLLGEVMGLPSQDTTRGGEASERAGGQATSSAPLAWATGCLASLGNWQAMGL